MHSRKFLNGPWAQVFLVPQRSVDALGTMGSRSFAEQTFTLNYNIGCFGFLDLLLSWVLQFERQATLSPVALVPLVKHNTGCSRIQELLSENGDVE